MSHSNGRGDDGGGQLWQMAGVIGALFLLVLYARYHSLLTAINDRVAVITNPVTSVLTSVIEHPSLASVTGGLLGLLGRLLHVWPVWAVAFLALAWTAVRAYGTWRTLQTRVAMVVVPPDDFKPSADAIASFGYQLVGSRRRILRWLDRPASAVTFKIMSGRRGRALYVVEAPGRAWPQLEHAIRSAYPGLELLPAADFLPAPAAPGGDRHVRRLELRPAQGSMHPLRAIDHGGYDVLQTLAAVAQAAGEDESVVIALTLEPLSPRERAATSRRILHDAGHSEYPAALPEDRYDGRAASLNIERRLDRQSLWSKLGANEPMFRMQLLIRAESPNRGRAKVMLLKVYGAFEQWMGGQNHLRAAGLPVLRSAFLGSDLPLVRRLFELRMRGLLWPLRRPVVSMGEVQPYLRPWLESCEARVLRQGVLLRPPANAPTEGLVLCESYEGRPVALTPLDARHHMKVVGPTGTGKTVLLANLALDNIDAGRATVVIDPAKGDLIESLLARIDRRHWDRVVLMAPWMDRTVGVNLMESPDPAMHDLVADQLVTVFRRLYEQYWGPRTEHVLRSAVLTLLRRPGSTLCDIPYLLFSAEARQRLTADLDDPISLEPFWREYEAMGAAERLRLVGPLMYKLQSVLLQGTMRDMLGQTRSTVDLGHLLDSDGILLVSLPKGEMGEETSRLLGSLLVARLWQVAQARVRRREEARADALLVLDEFHNLMNLPQTWDEIAVEARAYRWGLLLAHHHPAQLPTGMQRTFASNIRTQVNFRAEDEDAARALARGLEPLTAASLMRLEPFQIAVRAMLNGRPEPPFTGFTRPPRAGFGEQHSYELVKLALERWGRSRADVEAELRARYSGTDWDIDQRREEFA